MRSLSLCLAIGASSLLYAQGFQCSLIGTFNNHGPFNDIWGFVGQNGKEYALLGSTTGTVVVDCSNPANPIERGWFPYTQSTWRDIRTYGNYAYIVTEASSATGFQILDLTNPDAPTSLGIFGGSQVGDSHNICIDLGTGRLYTPGGDTGCRVWDLANPANPSYVGLAQSSNAYLHDLCVENGYGYGSMISDGVLRIWDATTFPPTTLSDSVTPAKFCHNAWPNAAATVCVTTDERAGGVTRFYDITNKSNPVPLSQLSPSPAATPHNAFIVGDYCHVAWYREGYQVIDIKDPATPVVVASYDTKPGQVTGFGGLWGCYPFQPSGNIYCSDMSDGLYIFRPHLTDLEIAHTPLADSADELDPYIVSANVTTSNALQSVTLRYRIDGGALQSVAMTPGAGGEYTAAIPAQDAPSLIEYHIDAADNEAARRTPRIGENRFLVGTETERWSDDFETNSGWSNGGSSNDWQRGTPGGRSGSSSSRGWMDPPTAFSGQSIWGNDIGTNTSNFNGAYPSNANNWLQSPSIPTNGVQGLRLGFRRHLSLAPGDLARVRVNGTTVWSSSASTSDSYWMPMEYDISSIANAASSLTIRFELDANGSGAAGGWSLDDVRLFTRHDCVPPISYGAGAAGTGGLVPSLTLNGAPVVGGSVTFVGSQLLPNSLGIMAISTASADFPAVGIQVLVDTTQAVLSTVAISGAGQATLPFAVPGSASVDGIYLYSQVVALDPAGPAGLLSSSAGMRLRICSSAP